MDANLFAELQPAIGARIEGVAIQGNILWLLLDNGKRIEIYDVYPGDVYMENHDGTAKG